MYDRGNTIHTNGAKLVSKVANGKHVELSSARSAKEAVSKAQTAQGKAKPLTKPPK